MAVIEVSAPNPPITDCKACAGTGVFQGIFHSGICNACTGLGLVCGDTGAPFYAAAEVLELRRRLNLSKRQIVPVLGSTAGGPGADYQGQVNAHHRGGGNWTGD